METFIDALIVSASVEYADPTKVLINFGWNLDGTTPDASAFTLAGKTITNVSVVGAQIVLTVSVAYVYGDSITVDYTVPPANRLTQDGTGYIVNSWVGQVVSNYVNDSDVSTYISGLTTALSDDILGKINTFVAGYKSDDGLTNLSDAYDVMYYLGNETAESSLRNLVKRAHDAVAVNSPTFTPYEGWATDGISSRIETNYNPNSDGSKFTLNSASQGIYSRTEGQRTGADCGCRVSSTQDKIYIDIRTASDVMVYPINADPAITNANNTALGLFIQTRLGAGYAYNFINKSLDGDSSATDVIPNLEIFIGCLNANGTAGRFNARQYSFHFMGNGMTQDNVNHLTDRFEALMYSNGKGVIA